MQYLNFDEHFGQFTADWVQAHAAEYGNNYDRMEERMPEVYLQWLNTPADWLDGETPGQYFTRYEDAPALVAWMRGYFEQGVPVPDQLLERISDLSTAGEAALLALQTDDTAPEEAMLTTITLLSEMDSIAPMARYIEWIAGRGEQDTRADMAAEALTAIGRRVVAPVLEAAVAASPAGLETFVDVLCNFPGEEAIYALVMRLFMAERDKRALYASLLGKLGDDRAIDALREALDDPDLGYLDYIELRNALEALGGDAPPERAFDGDPYFESLRRME